MPILPAVWLMFLTPLFAATGTQSSGKSQPEFQQNLPVLMYHYIRTVSDRQTDPVGFNLSVTQPDFTAQVNYLVTHGYSAITPTDLSEALHDGRSLPAKSVLLTFDDGYEDFYGVAFPILRRYNLKATLFVVTNFISRRDGRYITWEQLRELDNSGLITIGAHTRYHSDLTQVSSARAELEIRGSRDALEKFLGHPVTAFAYPGGRLNEL